MDDVQRTELLAALEACPFCGAGSFHVEETRLNKSPDMSGKQSPVISVAIHHWCVPVDGQPNRGGIHFAGRDADSAIALWNRRAAIRARGVG